MLYECVHHQVAVSSREIDDLMDSNADSKSLITLEASQNEIIQV